MTSSSSDVDDDDEEEDYSMTQIEDGLLLVDFPKQQDDDDADDDEYSEAEIENDLAILNGMNIEEDFNTWSSFRSSFIANPRKQRDSLTSLFSQSSKRLITTGGSMRFESSIDELNIYDDDDDDDHDDDNAGDHVMEEFNTSTTQFEWRDIRAWNMRLSRETVFSRYYFPEHWELRELKTIESFLDLNNHLARGLYDSRGQETTKSTITNIFSPGDYATKSVLLKRGPTLIDGGHERELMLFTHYFLVSKMELNMLVNILFTINSENPEYLNAEQLEDRFNEIDSDGNGLLDQSELKEMFKGMGIPISETALSDVINLFDDDNDGLINFNEFQSVMFDLEPKKEETRWTLGSLGEKIKKGISSFRVEPKVECGYPLSDILRVELIDVCYSESTKVYVNTSWAKFVFAIFLRGRDGPLVVVCSRTDQCLAWVDAFRICFVKSLKVRADNGCNKSKAIQALPGWEHCIIRASLFSLACIGDLSGLRRQLANPYSAMNINNKDEYHGYTALHYAAIMGRLDVVNLLLQYEASVDVQDNDGRTPLDHAALSDNSEVVKLLEHNGAKKGASAEALFKDAIDEQIKTKTKPTLTTRLLTIVKAKDASTAMSEGLSALHERGEKLGQLESKTAQLQADAADYAKMAKQLKEKSKKKANIFGR